MASIATEHIFKLDCVRRQEDVNTLLVRPVESRNGRSTWNPYCTYFQFYPNYFSPVNMIATQLLSTQYIGSWTKFFFKFIYCMSSYYIHHSKGVSNVAFSLLLMNRFNRTEYAVFTSCSRGTSLSRTARPL